MIQEKIDLRPINEFGSSCTLYWAARGHVTPEAFTQALKEVWGYHVDPANVRQEYWRNVPQGDEGMISITCNPGKGAYKVTVADADDVSAIAATSEMGGEA